MKEKNNTKPEKCPYCGKTDIVVNGYDSTTEKTPRYKCKNCKKTFKKNKNYYFKNKADKLFMVHILKLIKTNYSEINNAPKYGEPIKFQKLFSIKAADQKELDNMTLALDYIGSNKLKNLTPKLSIYLENNNIIIAKSFDNK